MPSGSTLVMDGAKYHNSEWTVDPIRETAEMYGVRIIVLPPYSPQLNPTENVFSKLRYRLPYQTSESLLDCIISSLLEVTWEDMYGWYDNCGYRFRNSVQ